MSTNPQDGSRPTVVLVHGAFADCFKLERRGRASCRQQGYGSRPPRTRCAASPIDVRLHRQATLEPDPRPGPCRRPLLRRRGDHQRRRRRRQRRRPGLRRRLRPGRGGDACSSYRRATRRTASLPRPLIQLRYPTGEGEETAAEFAIDPARFHEAFAADLPEEQTAVMAATQRPARRAGLLRAYRGSRLEEAAILGGGRHRRQGGRHRMSVRSMAERAGADDHRGRWLARYHAVAASGRR